MKIVRNSILCGAILFVVVPQLFAQDLFKYRSFSLGKNLASVLKLTDQKPSEVRVIHDRPVLMQELTWWPSNLPGSDVRSNSVERIVFSFFSGELYKISVTYDRRAIKGLTSEDMVQTMSAKYGIPSTPMRGSELRTGDELEPKQTVIATWEDSLYSSNLMRSSSFEEFGLVVYAKVQNAQAQTANAEAVTLDEKERPQKEADQQKKEGDDLEIARQKNKKTFQP